MICRPHKYIEEVWTRQRAITHTYGTIWLCYDSCWSPKSSLIRTATKLYRRWYENDSFAPKIFPSLLSAPTLMGNYHALNAILQALHTVGQKDVLIEVTPNQASSGQLRGCSTANKSNISVRRRYVLPHYRREYNETLLLSKGYTAAATYD